MTLSALVAYLTTFPTTIPEIKAVEFGDEEEILNRQNTRIQYPCLWVETPTVTLISEPPGRLFAFGLTVLHNVPKDDNRMAIERRSQALDIAEKAWRKLEDDEENGLFQLESTRTEGDPIQKWSGDRDTGFRFEVRLITGREDC